MFMWKKVNRKTEENMKDMIRLLVDDMTSSRAYRLPVKYPLRSIYRPPNRPTECCCSQVTSVCKPKPSLLHMSWHEL